MSQIQCAGIEHDMDLSRCRSLDNLDAVKDLRGNQARRGQAAKHDHPQQENTSDHHTQLAWHAVAQCPLPLSLDLFAIQGPADNQQAPSTELETAVSGSMLVGPALTYCRERGVCIEMTAAGAVFQLHDIVKNLRRIHLLVRTRLVISGMAAGAVRLIAGKPPSYDFIVARVA